MNIHGRFKLEYDKFIPGPRALPGALMLIFAWAVNFAALALLLKS